MTLFFFFLEAATIAKEGLREEEERGTEQKNGFRWKGGVRDWAGERKGSVPAHHKHWNGTLILLFSSQGFIHCFPEMTLSQGLLYSYLLCHYYYNIIIINMTLIHSFVQKMSFICLKVWLN